MSFVPQAQAASDEGKLRRPQKNPLTRQVVEQLYVLIFRGGLKEGDQLPSQAELAAQLGVSRLIVREATRILEAQGLLAVEQGRRLTVRRPSAEHLSSLFSILVEDDERSRIELLDVRRALELYAVQLAAANRTEADLDAMREAIDQLRAAAESADPASWADADVGFHLALTAASGNRILSLLLESIAVPWRAVGIRILQTTRARMRSLDTVIAEHETILDRVAAKDAAGAMAALTPHLDRASEHAAVAES